MNKYKKITIESYDEIVDKYTANVKYLHPRKESKIFLSLLNKKSSILDLGCGSGRDSKILAEKGYKVIGIDLSRKMIETAKKLVKNADFKVMDIMKLNFKNNDERYSGVEKFWSFFKKNEIERILKECGFKIIKIYINKPKNS